MKVAIIGAGPIGLYFANLCEKNNIDYTIFEADSFIGGQLTHLYPEKIIYNIPRIESIKSADYIDLLASKLDRSKFILGHKINAIEGLKQAYNHVIIATGIGEYQPRKLGIDNEEKYNVLYSLKDYSFLKNKKVVIFGGGDSALDWAKQLSEISEVTLVHRRDEFRGNVETIKECNLNLYLSYNPLAINDKTISIKSVKTEEIIELSYDYVLVNFGQVINKVEFSPSNTVYYIGDSTGSKTIAEGIKQADSLFETLFGGTYAKY